jgi:hypothetical protein
MHLASMAVVSSAYRSLRSDQLLRHKIRPLLARQEESREEKKSKEDDDRRSSTSKSTTATLAANYWTINRYQHCCYYWYIIIFIFGGVFISSIYNLWNFQLLSHRVPHIVTTTTSTTTTAKRAKRYNNLCTNHILNLRQIKPNECDPTGRIPPNFIAGTAVYNTNEPHFVIGSPLLSSKSKKSEPTTTANIVVHLPGTFTNPGDSSCFLRSIVKASGPVIGLNYGFLKSPDSDRNERCGTLDNTNDIIECLEEQHKDAIYGGTYGYDHHHQEQSLWEHVDIRDSISGRLGLLLAKLNKDYPDEGWDSYYTTTDDKAGSTINNLPLLPEPKWKKIVLLGHSQGAGHAAYLAQTKHLAGAVLLSGPQDECINCGGSPTTKYTTKFWIDNNFKTSRVTGFVYGDGRENYEPSISIIKNNWNRISRSGSLITWQQQQKQSSSSQQLTIHDIRNGGDNSSTFDVCKTPIISSILPQIDSPCIRMGHCSIVLDHSTPVIHNNNSNKNNDTANNTTTTATGTGTDNNDNDDNNVYLYDLLGIWSAIADVANC